MWRAGKNRTNWIRKLFTKKAATRLKRLVRDDRGIPEGGSRFRVTGWRRGFRQRNQDQAGRREMRSWLVSPISAIMNGEMVSVACFFRWGSARRGNGST